MTTTIAIISRLKRLLSSTCFNLSQSETSRTARSSIGAPGGPEVSLTAARTFDSLLRPERSLEHRRDAYLSEPE